MLNIFNLGLSGMQTFQKGLSNIGNNLANLNTPGFKRSAMLYQDLFYQYESQVGGAYVKGQGVKVSNNYVDFSQGTLQSSNNSLDLAIDGQGFFVTRHQGKDYFTRVGQFELDSHGYLINRTNKARVQGLNKSGLSDFSIAGLRQQKSSPTQKISLVDNLSTGSASANIDVTVFDAEGVQRKLKMTITNQSTITPNSWKVEVKESSGGLSVVGSGEIRFSPSGSPQVGFNEVNITLKAANGTTSFVTFDFGVPGTLSGVTQLSGGTTSTIKVGSQDGFAAGSMTKLSFDENGRAVINYSNGQSEKGPVLALAYFSQPSGQLKPVGQGNYQTINQQQVKYGAANSDNFGKIAARQLELSNVDIAAEFSEMMITQRGYQSSSQLITAANEMMQQALQMRSGR